MRSLSPLSVILALSLGPAWVAPPCAAQSADDTAELVERLAKEECEKLMNAVVPIAERQLLTKGEFPPYGAALTPEGQVTNVGDWTGSEHRPSAETIERLQEAFKAGARAGLYVATAMVLDVRVTLPGSGEKSDAIAVSLDHRDDYSKVVVLPYRLEDGNLAFGELFAQKGEGRIFASPDGG